SDLGRDIVLGQEDFTHLHGLLVMRDHHLREHDVRVIVLGGDLSGRPRLCLRIRGGPGRFGGVGGGRSGDGRGVGVFSLSVICAGGQNQGGGQGESGDGDGALHGGSLSEVVYGGESMKD